MNHGNRKAQSEAQRSSEAHAPMNKLSKTMDSSKCITKKMVIAARGNDLSK